MDTKMKLTSLHETLKHTRHLKEYEMFSNGIRFVFEHNEKKGVIQVPYKKNQKLVTHFSTKETEDWFQVLVDLCEEKVAEAFAEEPIKAKNESLAQPLHLNVMLRGKVISEHQRQLVKQLVDSGFEIFEVKSN